MNSTNSKGSKGNPCPVMIRVIAGERELEVPLYGKGIAPENVKNDEMILNQDVGKYNLVEKNGIIYREGEKDFPPITDKEKIEKLMKIKEYKESKEKEEAKVQKQAKRRGRPRKNPEIEDRAV